MKNLNEKELRETNGGGAIIMGGCTRPPYNNPKDMGRPTVHLPGGDIRF